MATTLWDGILAKSYRARPLPRQTLIVVGDAGAGKRGIVSRLLQPPLSVSGGDVRAAGGTNPSGTVTASNKPQLALAYSACPILGDGGDKELAGSVDVFKLTRECVDQLLPMCLTRDWLPSTTVMIVLDWSAPHSFLQSISDWIAILDGRVRQLIKDDEPFRQHLLAAVASKVAKQSREVSPLTDIDTAASSAGDGASVPADIIPEHCLLDNIGLPLIIAVAKSDILFKWEKEPGSEAIIDYIQQSLRVAAMHYGAALFYTTHTKLESYSPLRQYIIHTTLGAQDSRTSATAAVALQKPNVVDKALVYVPAGWDTWGKIRVIDAAFDCEAASGPNGRSVYQKRLQSAAFLSIQHAAKAAPLLVESEDEQKFLARHVDLLASGAPTDVPDDLSQRLKQLASSTTVKTPSTLASATNSSLPAQSGTTPATSTASNAVLANFFQSLLKKDGSSGTSGTGTPRAAVAAELDKMRKG